MKVAIDKGATIVERVFGIGIYTNYLFEALQMEAKKRNDFIIDFFDFSSNSNRLKDENYDIVHYPYFHPHFLTLPAKKTAKTVVTIHDLIPLVYPNQYPGGFKGTLRFLIQKKRMNNIDAFITVSETSKKDVVRFLKVPGEKVHTIHIAPSPVFKKITDYKRLRQVVEKFKLPKKFVLYLGDVYYSKNIPTLIAACTKAKTNLVIIGKQATEIENNEYVTLNNIKGPKDWLRYLTNTPHPELSHYKKITEMFENSTNVMRLGFVGNEELVALMNLATVYCQPSFYEGFGLGVVHAFTCGVPVIIAKTQALVEVTDDAALIADPYSVEDMSKMINILLNDTKFRNEYIRKGFERLKNFSWEKTAKDTIKVYEKVTKL